MEELHTLIYKVIRGRRSIVGANIEKLGLGHGQPRVLVYLSKHGPSSQREIALHYDIDPASISRMVDSLSSGGFITQRPCPGNRRANILEITDKGLNAVAQWQRLSDEAERVMLAGFSKEEEALLRGMLSRMGENLRRHGDA